MVGILGYDKTGTKIIATIAKMVIMMMMMMTINHSKIPVIGSNWAIAQQPVCCTFLISAKHYNNLVMWILSLTHLTDVMTQAQRDWIASLVLVGWHFHSFIQQMLPSVYHVSGATCVPGARDVPTSSPLWTKSLLSWSWQSSQLKQKTDTHSP